MSTELVTYLLIGADITYDKYKELEETYVNIDDDDDFTVDGMCGEYCYYGKTLAHKSEWEDTDVVIIDTSNIEKIKQEVKTKAKELYQLDIEPKLIMLPHFS